MPYGMPSASAPGGQYGCAARLALLQWRLLAAVTWQYYGATAQWLAS